MTTCKTCGQTVQAHWCHSELQLIIPPGKHQTLQSCINAYFRSAPLEDENDKCADRCQRRGCRCKQAYVTSWPDILTIQLKRWIPTGIPGYYRKEHRRVTLPHLLKDLPGSTQEYTLRAAIIHEGEAGAGHYVNVTKNREDGSWIHSSDTTITNHATDIPRRLEEAFLIFYERV